MSESQESRRGFSKPQKPISQIFVGFKHAGELGRDGRDVFVVNPSGRHALMFRIDQDGDACRVQDV